MNLVLLWPLPASSLPFSAKHFPRSRSLVPQVHSQDSTPASPGTPSYVLGCRHRCSKVSIERAGIWGFCSLRSPQGLEWYQAPRRRTTGLCWLKTIMTTTGSLAERGLSCRPVTAAALALALPLSLEHPRAPPGRAAPACKPGPGATCGGSPGSAALLWGLCPVPPATPPFGRLFTPGDSPATSPCQFRAPASPVEPLPWAPPSPFCQ